MFSLHCTVGRLVEVKIGPAFDVSEVPALGKRVVDMLAQHQGKMIYASDLRGASSLTPIAQEKLTDLLRSDNPRMERNAILVDRGGRVGMQALRIVMDADARGRRVFTDASTLCAWLADVLAPDEQQQLAIFLDA